MSEIKCEGDRHVWYTFSTLAAGRTVACHCGRVQLEITREDGWHDVAYVRLIGQVEIAVRVPV
jgi:hypothetical protein